jgi:hypothetical protein
MQTAFKVSSRTYSVLLTMYPRELRRRFAAEMTDVFDQQLQGAWDESGFAGLARVWLIFVALPAQIGQPIVIVPTLSLIGNSAIFLVLMRALSPLAALCRIYRH